MKNLLLVLTLCLSSVISNATTFYVSTTGNNAAAGTMAAPWRTLAYAASSVTTSGNIIHILPGTYTENTACILAVGVSIEGEGITSHIISTYTGGAAISLSSNVDGTNGNQSLSNFKLSGSNLTGRQGIMVQSRSNVKVFNMTIQDFLGDGILFKGAIGYGQPTTYATGNVLYNCIITNNSDRAYGQGNIVATGYRGMLIHDNIITQMSRPLGSNGNSYSATNEGYSEGLKFYNNKSYRNSADENEWSFHCEMWNSQGGMEFYNNEFHNGSQMIDWAGEENGTGIIPGTYAYAAYVHDNLFQLDIPKTTATAFQEVGVNIEGNCDGIIVSNNHFKNMPYGVQMTGANSTTFLRNVTINNNLFENGGFVNAEWGFDIAILTHCDATHCVPISGIQILNNTFVTNSLSALFVYMNSGTSVSNVQFTNNIVKGVRSYGFMTFMENAGTKTNFTVKNNLLYQNANNNAISLQLGASLPTVWTYTGNIVANPLLDGTFHLQTGSPAINAGINVGLPFSGAAPDLGTFESSGTAVNALPIANAGTDQTNTLPTNSVNLTGSGTDPDGSIAAYLWTKISGPTSGTITNTASATTTITGLVQGSYQFELKVTDNAGATSTDNMLVIVNSAPVNIIPIANAGVDKTVVLPTSTVSLIGSGTDVGGTIASYLWTKVSGPTGGTIATATTATTSVSGLTAGVYKFELKVTDNAAANGKDTVNVTVSTTLNQVPTANAGADKTVVLPTSTVSFTGTGTDTDGTIASYLWTKISGPAGGTIATATTTTASISGLTAGVYKYELKVTDNVAAIGKDTVQVTVNTAGNQVPTANAGADKTVVLPTSTVSLTGTGTDTDGTIASYLWTKISGPAGGTIATATTTTASISGLTAGVYKYELKVTDNVAAIGKDTVQVTVNTAGNQVPTANAGADKTVVLPTSTVSLTGTGTDTDGTIASYLWTKISGPTGGTIATATTATTSVSGLTAGVYKFELKVTDNAAAIGKDTVQVTVNTASAANNAYGGVRWAIPGKIEAENFDNGGQNVAYYDLSASNYGNYYRVSDYVDIQPSTESSPNIGWILAGEWLKYSVNVTTAGTYTIAARIASSQIGKSFRIEMDGIVIATVKVPNTGSTQSWQTVYIPNINLTTGNKLMRIYASTGGSYNINYIKFTATSTVAVRANSTDSINQVETNTTIKTFPLPFSTSFTVNLFGKTNGVYNLTLIDLTGNTVWRKEVTKNSESFNETLYMGNLLDGVYILEVIAPDQKKSAHKIIKN